MPTPDAQRVPYSQLRYSRAACRYRLPSGRFMPAKAVRQVIDDDLEARAGRMQDLARQLRDGELSVDAWHAAMKEQVKQVHLANVAAARGGFHAMDASGYGRAGGRLRFHYGKLADFAAALRDNPEMVQSPAFLARVALYAAAGRATYHVEEMGQQADAGFGWVQSILDSEARHCGECPELAARGRIPIAEMVAPGERECGPQCKCSLEYFREQA